MAVLVGGEGLDGREPPGDPPPPSRSRPTCMIGVLSLSDIPCGVCVCCCPAAKPSLHLPSSRIRLSAVEPLMANPDAKYIHRGSPPSAKFMLPRTASQSTGPS